jgi:DNA repair exonuclease SbcCD ATPase subunit
MQEEIKHVISKYDEQLIGVDDLILSLHLGGMLRQNASELEEVMEELRNSGVDNIDKYTELLEQKDKTLKDIEGIGSVEEQIEQCDKQLHELRQQIRTLISERSTARCKVISQWNKIGPLKVALLPLGSIIFLIKGTLTDPFKE